MKPETLKQSFASWARILFAAATMAFGCAAHAQIPVTDLASITQSVTQQAETIAKWVAQAKQIEQQISQAKQQYDAFTGSRGMGNLLNNSALNSALPNDWAAVSANVRSTAAYATERSKYPTYPSSPKANTLYDVIASQNASTSDFYSRSTDRVKQSQSLMGQIDSATDPAAKADLTNRLVSEQNLIQGNQQVLATLQAKQKQELDEANMAAAKEWRCNEFKSTNC